MKRAWVWSVALFLVVTLLAGTAVAVTDTTTFQFTEAVFNTCNDDLTVINGKETITSEITRLSGGGFKVFFRDKKVGTGSGLTGKQYRYRNVFTDTFTASATGGLVSTSPSQFITMKKVGGPTSENMDI